MKKTFTLIMIIAFAIVLSAQEKIKQSETGFIFSNFDNFGLSFKKGSNKAMWRFKTVMLSAGNIKYTSDTLSTANFGFGLSIGKEYRKILNENFESFLGYDLGYTHSYSKSKKGISYYDIYTKNNTNSYSLNLVLGANYVIKNQLVFGIEILPGFAYNKTITENGDKTLNQKAKPEKREVNSFDFGFSNTSARLTVAYRFRK